ncbi:hypothetical protein GCM10007854_01280 [Algimonas porphyrae]|uniref:Apple domain-containing protein n=1 Tax=Algimonas porphyrae TaxID=1128113 RepID=A0ABQ5UV95_9PROT|nr:PAN domain-containing protein [Algimonas porphyrae]GLQ19173.1 hypothetical protein GCM10007854_01280 [Algimonas porphyrae]
MRILNLTLLSTILAAPAFAADLGTYRPGTPYHSTVVPGADVCESQCAGDARCRGWNYVKAVPSAPGVCEFQSSVGQPISSAVSISGISPSATPMPGRVVAGDTHTIRVGTAVTPIPEQRRIVRQAVPAQSGAHQPATYRSAAPQGLQPMLDTQARIVRPAQQPAPAPRGRARTAPQSQQFRSPQPQAPFRAQIPGQMQPGYGQIATAQPVIAQPALRQGRPPIGQPIPAPETYPASQGSGYQSQTVQPKMSQAPVYQGQMNQGQPYQGPISQGPISQGPIYQGQPVQSPMAGARQASPQAMPRSSVTRPIGFHQGQAASPSLYGHLNDDVPRAAAPVTQGYAQPVTPIDQTQLAGARR